MNLKNSVFVSVGLLLSTSVFGAESSCLPLDAPIRIHADQVKFDGNTILAGNIPGQSADSGTVQLGSVSTNLGSQQNVVRIGRDSVDGKIQLNLTPTSGSCKDSSSSANYGDSTGACKLANLDGTITISKSAMDDIRNKFGSSSGAVSGWNSKQIDQMVDPATRSATSKASVNSPCVSGVAIQGIVSKSKDGGVLYNASIYLYLNNGNHGYMLYALSDQKSKSYSDERIQVSEASGYASEVRVAK